MENQRIYIDELVLTLKNKALLFDVRTPDEFKKGHIPGAINLPMFSNEERVLVGTSYKKEGRHPAILLGLDIIGPKMRELVEKVQEVVGAPKDAEAFVLNCWRGGMRSASVAWLLRTYGYEVKTLIEGYKSYRSWALAEFEKEFELIVLGGHTGSGKTDLLYQIQAQGHFIIDLEGLANHRGSAFGSLNLPNQPSQQQFENDLAFALSDSKGQAIWIEDEARNVGRCGIPDSIFTRMRSSRVLFLQKSVSRRLDLLMKVYGESNVELLRGSFQKIKKRIGGDRLKEAEDFLDAGEVREAAAIALAYYDKSYEYGLSKRAETSIDYLKISDDRRHEEIVSMVIKFREILIQKIR